MKSKFRWGSHFCAWIICDFNPRLPYLPSFIGTVGSSGHLSPSTTTPTL